MAAPQRHYWPWLAIAAVALALIAGGGYVSRPSFRGRMLAGANARLSAVLRRQFSIGSVRYRFPMSIVIANVSVASRDSLSHGVLASIAEIRVVVNPLWSLLNRRFTVSTIALRDASINIEQYPDGTWNFSGLLKSDSTKRAPQGGKNFPPLALSGISIRNMAVRLKTPTTAESIELVGLSLGLRMGGTKLIADIRDLQLFDRTRRFGISRVSGRFAVSGDTIKAEHLQVQSGSSSLALSAWLDGKTRSLSLSECRAVLELQDLSALAAMPGPAWSGTIRLDATAAGSLDAPRGRASVTAGPCVINGMRIDGLDARAVIDGSVVTMEKLLLKSGPGEIAASARVDDKLKAYSGAVTVNRFDLGRLLPQTKKALATDLNATINFSGQGFAFAAMAGQARLAMGRSTVNAIPISSLEARVSMSDGVATIERFTLQSGQASLTVSGDIYKDAVSVELETDEIELAQFGPLFGLNNLSGKLRFTGLVSGVLKNPDVIGTFRLKEAALASFACHYFDGNMSIKSIATRPVGDGKFTASELVIGKQTIDKVELLAELRGIEWGGFSVVVDKDSVTQAQIVGRAEIDHKNINLIISKLNYFSVDQYVCNSQPIQVTLQGSDVTLKPTELLLARGRVRLEGQYRADRTFKATISGRDIDSRRLVKLAGLDKTVHGVIDFDIAASGPLADPVLKLSLDIDNPRFEQFAYDGLSLAADYSGQTVRLHKLAIYHYGQESDITAEVGINLGLGPGMGKLLDRPMSAEVVLRDIGTGVFFPLADLLSVMEGRVDVNVKVSGTPFKPVLSGNLTINQAKMVLRPLGMYLHNVQAMAHFNADSVVVDNVTGLTEGTGTVQLGGYMLLKQFIPTAMRFDVVTQKSPVRNIPFIEANVNSRIVIGGTMDYVKIGGTVQVNSALITLPFAPAEEPPPPEGSPKPMDLDLSITGTNGIWLRNKDADIELKIDNLNVRMQQNVLFLSGKLEPIRGVYRFLDRTFDIVSGDLTFTNAAVINPELNLDAQTVLSDSVRTEIYLKVGGTALQPKLSFTSKPAMSEQNILTLLGAGTTIADIGKMDVAGQAINRGLDYALGQVTGKFQNRTGLDMLKVKTIAGSEKGAQITLGKYVAPKVFVSYTQGFSSSISNEFKAEYLFGPRSAVFAQKDAQGKYNLGVRMKFKY